MQMRGIQKHSVTTTSFFTGAFEEDKQEESLLA
jgi:GTP cyclohydrolase I